MKMNVRAWMLFALTPLAIGLTGCGSQSVDSRDIEFNGGLAYQVNHQDPFTGIVTYVHDTPNFVGKLYGLAQIPGYNFAWAGNFADNINAEKNFTCSFHYVKGIMNGDAECKNDEGDETASFSVDEKSLFDGKATLYSPRDAKKKCAKLNFTHGVLDGRQQTYGDDGSTVIDDLNIANGIKDGREIVKDEAGDVISDGTWKEGKPSDGSFTDVKVDIGPDGAQNIKLSTIENYANGLQNGKASFYSANKNFKSPSENILSSGEFENGHRTGLWKDNSPPPILLQEINVDGRPVLWDFPPYRTGSMQQGNYARYVALRDCDSYKSTWSQGHLAGKVECFDIQHRPLLEFEIENGQLVGDITYHKPNSGEIVTIHQQDGKVVGQATPGAQSTGTPQPISASSTPGGGDECVNKWINAFHREQGADASISNDQLNEWQEDCQQGKQAP